MINTRLAVKETIRFLFEKITEDGLYNFSQSEIDEAVEQMHDDDGFIEPLIEFFDEHINDFGENYGLFKND